MTRVACALIERDGKLLVARRSKKMSHPLKWEFPGGKIETGESAEACLQREIWEELGSRIEIQLSLSPVTHHYPGKTIELFPFICSLKSGVPDPAEHDLAVFLNDDELLALDWLEADLPVLREYIELKKNTRAN